MRGRRGRCRRKNHRFSLIDFLSTYTEPNLETEMKKQAKDYIDSWGGSYQSSLGHPSVPDLWETSIPSNPLYDNYTIITTTNTYTGMMPSSSTVFPNVKEQLDINNPEDIGKVVDRVNKLLMSLLPKTIIYTVQKMDGKDQIIINFDLSVLKSDDEKERVILFDDEE